MLKDESGEKSAETKRFFKGGRRKETGRRESGKVQKVNHQPGLLPVWEHATREGAHRWSSSVTRSLVKLVNINVVDNAPAIHRHQI